MKPSEHKWVGGSIKDSEGLRFMCLRNWLGRGFSLETFQIFLEPRFPHSCADITLNLGSLKEGAQGLSSGGGCQDRASPQQD